MSFRVLVETVRPEFESKDWTDEARAKRKWGMGGAIVGEIRGHGRVYRVEHDDGTEAYYEPRELKVI